MSANIEEKVDGDILTITIDLSKSLGPSKSGKTTIIASSHGAILVPYGDSVVSVNLNVYKKK